MKEEEEETGQRQFISPESLVWINVSVNKELGGAILAPHPWTHAHQHKKKRLCNKSFFSMLHHTLYLTCFYVFKDFLENKRTKKLRQAH